MGRVDVIWAKKRRDSPRRVGWLQKRGMAPYLKPPLAEQGRKRWTEVVPSRERASSRGDRDHRGWSRHQVRWVPHRFSSLCQICPSRNNPWNLRQRQRCVISNRNSWFFCILEVLLQTGGGAQMPHSTSHDDNTSRFGMTDQRSRTIAVGETTHFLLFFLKSNKHTRTKRISFAMFGVNDPS